MFFLKGDHWTNANCTLFIAVCAWLDKNKWNSEDSELQVDSQVTVFGEKAGLPVAMNSFWGRVVATPVAGSDVYEVEAANGTKAQYSRRDLRHRSSTQHVHAGVTDDKVHDSYSMRCFVAKTLKDLHEEGVLKEQDLRVLCVHSGRLERKRERTHVTLSIRLT